MERMLQSQDGSKLYKYMEGQRGRIVYNVHFNTGTIHLAPGYPGE